MSKSTRSNYNFVASFYDGLAALYSLGQIPACKRSQLCWIRPGDRVLFAGAGSGAEAALAAQRGASVTVVELAPAMVAAARRRFRTQGLEEVIEVIAGDILEHVRDPGYDVVVSHFFLNVFGEAVMAQVLGHLARQLRPGGHLLIADFAPPGAGLALGAARRLYFGCAVLAFRLLAGNPLHGLYDYARHLPAAGLRLQASRDFSLLGRGPALFQTLAATRDRGGDRLPDPVRRIVQGPGRVNPT